MSGRLMGCTLYPLCISLPRLLLFLDPTSSQVSGTWRSETLALEDSLSETPWAGMYHQPKGLAGQFIVDDHLCYSSTKIPYCVSLPSQKNSGYVLVVGTYVVTQGKTMDTSTKARHSVELGRCTRELNRY